MAGRGPDRLGAQGPGGEGPRGDRLREEALPATNQAAFDQPKPLPHSMTAKSAYELARAIRRYSTMRDAAAAYTQLHKQWPAAIAEAVSAALFPAVTTATARRMVRHWQSHIDDPRLAARLIDKTARPRQRKHRASAHG